MIFGTDRRRARRVAEDSHLTDNLVGADGRQNHGSAGRLEDDLGMAVDDQISRIGQIPLPHEPAAGLKADPLAHDGQELQLSRLDLGKHRYSPKHLEFLFEAHFLPSKSRVSLIPCSTDLCVFLVQSIGY